MKIKTIDIIGKEWFDKVNGNSYFSARITVNFGMKNEKTFAVPFQYGYNDQYQYMAMKSLVVNGLIEKPEHDFDLVAWRYSCEHGITLRTNKYDGCKKREVIEFGAL